jgi:threonine/homoserine/homoserine lactone efflux protein
VGGAIGQLLPFAVGVGLSPMPIVAVVLLLLTPRGRVNGAAFLLGSIVGIALTGTVLLALADPTGASEEGGPATWVSWLKLVLGVLLVLVAVRQWRARPHAGDDVATPRWMGALDGFTPAKSLGAGVVVDALNPKNLLLILGGAAAVAQTGIPAGEQAVAWAIFTLIGASGVALPVVIDVALGDRAGPVLDRLKTWMARNNAAIMAALCLVIGAKLIGDAISGFSA